MDPEETENFIFPKPYYICKGNRPSCSCADGSLPALRPLCKDGLFPECPGACPDGSDAVIDESLGMCHPRHQISCEK